jgi:hypothetical protein
LQAQRDEANQDQLGEMLRQEILPDAVDYFTGKGGFAVHPRPRFKPRFKRTRKIEASLTRPGDMAVDEDFDSDEDELDEEGGSDEEEIDLEVQPASKKRKGGK